MTQAWWYLLLESSTAPTPAPAPAPAPTNYVLSPNDPTQAPPWYYYEMTAGEGTIVAANDVTLYEFNEAVTLDNDYPYLNNNLDEETPAGAMRFGATVKALGRDFVVFDVGNGVNAFAAIFNLTTGQFVDWYVAGTYIAGTSASIDEVETGIYEVGIVGPAGGTFYYAALYPSDDDQWGGYNGDIAKGLYVGGIYGYVE